MGRSRVRLVEELGMSAVEARYVFSDIPTAEGDADGRDAEAPSQDERDQDEAAGVAVGE